MRGLLAEYGEAPAKLPYKLLQAIPYMLEDAENELSLVARQFIQQLYEHVALLNQSIKEVEGKLHTLISPKKEYELLLSIPSVGPTVAATIMASINDIHSYKNGRQLAAWIGLTPSQHASGETNRMGKITKLGNRSLRKMLIIGAREVLNWADGKDDALNLWLQKIKTKMHNCKCVTAFANKMARIIWAVLTTKQLFDATKACA